MFLSKNPFKNLLKFSNKLFIIVILKIIQTKLSSEISPSECLDAISGHQNNNLKYNDCATSRFSKELDPQMSLPYISSIIKMKDSLG
jgi:hypothetical protein